METQFYIDEERDINLRGLFFSILLKWRSILMCMVVFAVIAGGSSYMKSAKLAEKNRALIEEEQSTLSAQEREEAAKAREEAAAKALNATEITNVKHVAGVVNEYQQMYDAQKRYNDNSIYMRLDPTAVHPYENLWQEAAHGLLLYPVGHDYTHRDRETIRKDFVKFFLRIQEILCIMVENLSVAIKRICKHS